MAVFQRAFAAIDEYALAGDKQGMLFGGWLANALHNVPGVLQYYSDDASLNAQRITNRLEVLPERLRTSNAPERLITDCNRILSECDAARDLGLKEDLSDIDLAPDTDMCLYLDILYEACLVMRLTENCSSKSDNRWADLDNSWSAWAYEQAKLSGLIASTLRTLPSGLVKWNEFDRKAFRRNACKASRHIPRAERFLWKKVHLADKPAIFKAFKWLPW